VIHRASHEPRIEAWALWPTTNEHTKILRLHYNGILLDKTERKELESEIKLCHFLLKV
jgi:hypothetical protein